MLNRGLAAGEADHRVGADAETWQRPDSESHILRACRAFDRNVTPLQPPRKTGGELEKTKPRPSGLLRPLWVTQGLSERVVRLPGRAIQKEGVEHAAPTETDPPFSRAYLEDAPNVVGLSTCHIQLGAKQYPPSKSP